MRSFLLSVLLLLPAATLACDARIVIDETDPTPDPEPEPEPRPDPEPDPNAAFCRTASLSPSSTRAVAAAVTPEHVDLIHWDGRTTRIDPWKQPPPADVNGTVDVRAGGDLVAITATWSKFQPPEAKSYITWLDREGNRVDAWEADLALSVGVIAPDGTSLLHGWDPGAAASTHMVRRPDGRRIDLEGIYSVFGPVHDGWLAVQLLGSGGSSAGYGFVDTRSGATVAASSIPATAYPTRTPRGLAFVEPVTGGARLVEARPDGTDEAFVPLDGPVLEGLSLVQVNESGIALLAAWESPFFRLDMNTATAIRIDVPSPNRMELLRDSCGLYNVMLETSGDVFVPLRDESVAQVFSFDPVSGDASAVGRPIGAPGFLSFGERDGTFLIAAGDGSDTFCPIFDWTREPPRDAVPVGTIQIAREGQDLVHVLPVEYVWGVPWSHPVSRGGGCVAAFGEDETLLLDVATGEEHRAPAAGGWVWLD